MLHGGAVPVVACGRATAESLDCISWSSIFAKGQVTSQKMLIFSCFESCKSTLAMDQVWSIIMWSFQALYRGAYPKADHLLQEYAPGTSEAMLASSGTTLGGDYFC
eukprot:2023811-Pyramimonas_sp.AAC.1